VPDFIVLFTILNPIILNSDCPASLSIQFRGTVEKAVFSDKLSSSVKISHAARFVFAKKSKV